MKRRLVQKEVRQYTCEHCGTRYERRLPIERSSRWCSWKCRSEAASVARGGVLKPLDKTMGPYQFMKLRQRVYAKTNGYCHYCAKRLDGIFRVDHVLAVKRGGTHDFENLVPACVSCSVRKGSMLVDDFLAIIREEERVRLAAERERAAKLAAQRRLQESFWLN